MDDIPIRVKPTRSQLNRERAKKRATYQRGRASGLVDPAPMMTTAAPSSNRFELLPDDPEPQVPTPQPEEMELPPLTQPKSNVLTQQDFQIRERAMFIDIASLPSEAMIQLSITRKFTDHNVAANAMRAADKVWGGNGDLERILGYQARYTYVHNWPLTTEDTLTQIRSEANEGFHTEDEVAARYQRFTVASVTPLDYYFVHTEHMGADNVFFTLFSTISTPLELDAHMTCLYNQVAKALLRHLDLSLGGSGTGPPYKTSGLRLS
jgi:hypothetical protein